MAADPHAYDWLFDMLGESGCITVVSAGRNGGIDKAFGVGPLDGPPPDFDQVAVARRTDVTVVVEHNGFQGARPEVLRPASRASATGRAASIFWNVNGVVRVALARKGKVVCSFELIDPDEEELAGLPRGLRPLVRQLDDPGADLVAIGAAMVETFTETAFGQELLATAEPVDLTPPASDLEIWTEHLRIDEFQPGLQAVVTTLDPGEQRRLAEWCAVAAVEEAGQADEPVVRAAVEAFGDADAARHDVALSSLQSRLIMESDRLESQAEDPEASDGARIARVAEAHSRQPSWAVKAVRYARHPDASGAALTCLEALLVTASCSQTERRSLFEEDDRRGRWIAGWARMQRPFDVAAAVASMLREPADLWGRPRDRLPAPLTRQERAEAVRVDAEREARGDFDTWQYERGGW